MNGCFLWNGVKAWSSLQRKFQMISERWKFLSLFLIFVMSAAQIFKVKKTAPKDCGFFTFLFFLRIRTGGRDASIKDITTRWPSRRSLATKPDLKILFLPSEPALKRCRAPMLSHCSFWEKMHTALSFLREEASVGSCWPRCQYGLQRFPVAHTLLKG